MRIYPTVFVRAGLAAALLYFTLSGPALAHGVRCRVMEEAACVVVRFTYDDGEAMSYASVRVFSPADEKIEFQNGRTDRTGCFAFVPDAAGEWRISAEDGMGHRAEKRVAFRHPETAPNTPAPPPKSDPAGLPKAWGVLFGLSVIANICLAATALKFRASLKQRQKP